MKLKVLALALALFTLPSFAQTTINDGTRTWYPVANESSSTTITTTLKNVLYEFGTNVGVSSSGKDCTVAPGCFNGTTTLVAWNKFVVFYTNFPFSDPAPGLSKKLYVAETTSAQAFTVVVNGTSTTVTVPALTVVTPPPPTGYGPMTFIPGQSYSMVATNVLVVPNSPVAALLTTFPLPAYQFYAAILANITMTTTINGVPFQCTFVSTSSSASSVSSTCVPAPLSH